jgi:hypothetical protein
MFLYGKKQANTTVKVKIFIDRIGKVKASVFRGV